MAVTVFKSQGFHPEIVQFAVGSPLGSVSREPDPFFGRDHPLGNSCLP